MNSDQSLKACGATTYKRDIKLSGKSQGEKRNARRIKGGKNWRGGKVKGA